jgi:hypothetical protein
MQHPAQPKVLCGFYRPPDCGWAFSSAVVFSGACVRFFWSISTHASGPENQALPRCQRLRLVG